MVNSASGIMTTTVVAAAAAAARKHGKHLTAVKRKNPTLLPVFASSNFVCKNFVEEFYKIVLGDKITSWKSLRMSIRKFPAKMRSIRLNFSTTVLTGFPRGTWRLYC